MKYENKRFTRCGLGKLFYFPSIFDLGKDDQDMVSILHSDNLLSMGRDSGYFKIVTLSNGSMILPPAIFQALELNARHLGHVYTDIVNRVKSYHHGKQAPSHLTSLFKFSLNLANDKKFVLDFVFIHQSKAKESDLLTRCEKDHIIIARLYFEVNEVKTSLDTIKNRCVLDADDFIEFLIQEKPFVGVATSGLLQILSDQEDENNDCLFSDYAKYDCIFQERKYLQIN